MKRERDEVSKLLELKTRDLVNILMSTVNDLADNIKADEEEKKDHVNKEAIDAMDVKIAKMESLIARGLEEMKGGIDELAVGPGRGGLGRGEWRNCKSLREHRRTP